jgi:hypothetical protein
VSRYGRDFSLHIPHGVEVMASTGGVISVLTNQQLAGVVLSVLTNQQLARVVLSVLTNQ